MIRSIRFWTRSRHRASHPPGRGFTVLEVLFVMGIMSVIMVIGLPSLMTNLRRAKLEGPLRQAMTLMSLARFEAVKKGVPVGVEPDFADDQLLTFRDMDDNGSFSAGDEILNILTLEKGLYFWHPDDANAEGPATVAATTNSIFDATGAASTSGAFFVSDGRENHLSVEIANAATARFVLKKWERGTTGPSVWWQEGAFDSGGPLWEWY